MKKILHFTLVILGLFVFTSCDKDDKTDQRHPITGLWIGTYNILEAAESGHSFYYSFFIRNDDTVQVQGVGADGNTYYGIGTWSLNNATFTAEIRTTNLSQQGAVQHATAVYDKRKGVLRDGVVESEGGFFKASFNLTRVN